MVKKIIITEKMARRLAEDELLMEADLSKSDIEKIAKDAAIKAVGSDRELKKEMEKKVKEIVAGCVNTLFQTLWQRRNFYEDEIKR